MSAKSLPYTYQKNNVYFLQVALPDKKLYRRSLATDSFREAGALMGQIIPLVKEFKKGRIDLALLSRCVDSVLNTAEQQAALSVQASIQGLLNVAPVVSTPVTNKPVVVAPTAPKLSLYDAWLQFKEWKTINTERKDGLAWSTPQAKKNENAFEVVATLLGEDCDVTTLTPETVSRAFKSIESLPLRNRLPYSRMSIKDCLECDDVADDDLIGAEAYNHHVKLFSQFFKTFLTVERKVIPSSLDLMVDVKSMSVKRSKGSYTKPEIKTFIDYAINRCEKISMKWIILLLVYTGARRGEIAKLKASQVKFDENGCNRHYLLIAEGGDGKTENATREVVLHQDLIDYGFLDFINGKEGYLFPDIASTSLNDLSQDFIAIRDELNIPEFDIQGLKRTMHSTRHTFTTFTGGLVKKDSDLQQVIGHRKTGLGVTARYTHRIPLEHTCYVVDLLNWK